MCGFYYIAFMEYMFAGKTLLEYTDLFSVSDYKKNYKIIYKYFKDKYDGRSKSRVQFKKIDETRNDVLEEIKHNDLISEKYKKTCKYLNYVKIVFNIQINICAITAGIKNYKSITNKKKEKHDKIVWFGKVKYY